jgi:NAD(P)H-nitrite reductase large subunit
MNMEKVVCYCLNITNGMIKDAVDAGATTLEEVQEATGAATVCGACTEAVQNLVDYFCAERNSQ